MEERADEEEDGATEVEGTECEEEGEEGDGPEGESQFDDIRDESVDHQVDRHHDLSSPAPLLVRNRH